jgi:hypothetical protein
MKIKWSVLILGSRLIAPVALSLALPSFGATILFNNLLAPGAGNRSPNPTSVFQSFSNQAGSFSLTDVQLLLGGSPTDNNSFSVDLYADSSTKPTGGLIDHIGSLSDSSLIANTNHVYDFPTAAFALAPNTRYWVGLSTTSGTGGSNVNWDIEGVSGAVPPGDVGVTGEFIDVAGVVSPDDFGGFRQALQMQVTVSPTVQSSVPEPSAFLLGAAGLLALAVQFSRRSATAFRAPAPTTSLAATSAIL